MSRIRKLSRRQAIRLGATTVGGLALSGFLTDPMLAMAGPADGSRPEIGYFERFGVDPGVIREALQVALASGGGHADLYFQHRITNSYALEDGDVNRAGCGIELGMGVRVLKGDQTGYGFTENLSKEGIVRAARTAAAIARDAARGGPGSLHLSAGGPSRYPMARPWLDVSSADRLKLLNTLNERFFKEDKRIRKVTVQFMDQTCALLVADSAGRLVEDLQPLTSLVVFCVAEQKGRREQVRYRLSGRAGLEFYTPARIDRVVKEAVARTVVLFDAVPAPAGEMPVVLAAGSSGILLHEAIGHGMEADFNRKGISIYADKIGKPVARPFVSIVDDATAPGARGSINVDDEGTVAGRTVLVEDGILTSYLHDLVSARHYKLDPTGNGRRESYRFPPVPRMRSTYMEPGPHKRDEIIASVKRGIYCSTFTNGQVRIGAGDFTFYVQNGCLIENGKLTRPIKDVNIIGNGPEVLQRIDMVADDLLIEEEGWTCGKAGQSVPVSQGLPTVRVGALTVGGRS